MADVDVSVEVAAAPEPEPAPASEDDAMAKSDASWLAQSFSTLLQSSKGFKSSRLRSRTFEWGFRSNANDLRAAVDCVEVLEPRRHNNVFGFSLNLGALDSRWRLPAGVTFWPPKDVDLAFLGIFIARSRRCDGVRVRALATLLYVAASRPK